MDFSKSLICDEKIQEIIDNSSVADGRQAIRVIKHDSSLSLSKNDFLPSVMERNNNTMPGNNEQRNKNISSFGVSLLDTLDHALSFVEAVPSLRQKAKSYAIGKVLRNKGTIGPIDSLGHFQYYLFDPIGSNPVVDFVYCEKEK